MSKAGEVYENPVTGERAVVRVGTEESGGELLVLDLYVRPGCMAASEHVLPNIGQRFTVISGCVGFRLDGREGVAGPGRKLVVPLGLAHDWWIAGEEEAHVVDELRGEAAALERFEVMFSMLFGLARDGKTDKKGRPNILQAALFAQEFDDVMRFTRPPRVVQRLVFGALAPVARLLGYRATYPEYLRLGPLVEEMPPATEKGRGGSIAAEGTPRGEGDPS